MKNVRDSQLRTSIVISHEEFDHILSELTSNMVKASYTLEGIDYEPNYHWGEVLPEDEMEAYVDENFYEDITKFYKKLAGYFDVKEVTSIHIDDCDSPVGVWITYKD